MNMESVAVLRWISSETVARGEEAVVAELEPALIDAVRGNGLTPSGDMSVRQVDPSEYPQTIAAKPADDPGALLHLAEVDID
jgi:hypothetical protein